MSPGDDKFQSNVHNIFIIFERKLGLYFFKIRVIIKTSAINRYYNNILLYNASLFISFYKLPGFFKSIFNTFTLFYFHLKSDMTVTNKYQSV